MAQVRYYRKLSPAVKLFIPQGGGNLELRFETIDGVLGWYATDQDFVHAEFEKMMREQRGGITEVSEEEFKTDYLEKKNQMGASSSASSKMWREELSPSLSRLGQDPSARLGSGSLATALRVNGSLDPRRNNRANLEADPVPLTPKRIDGTVMAGGAEASAAVPTEEPKETFVPNVGKRKPAKSR